jgi:hypothetical protein
MVGEAASVQRAGAALGALGIVLIAVALGLPGVPPKSSDSVEHLREVLTGHRRAFLVGTFLAGLGALGLLCFLGTLRDRLGRVERSGPGVTVAVTGGLFAVTMVLSGMAVASGVALGAAEMADPSLVRAAIDTTNVLIELSKFGFAALLLGTVAASAPEPLSANFRRLGLVAAVVLVASALPPFLADDGTWQFGGPPDLLASVPAIAWLIALCVRLGRSR